MSEITDEAKREYVIGGTPMRARPLEPALYIVSTPIGNLGDMTCVAWRSWPVPMCWLVKIRGSRGFCLTVMESHAVRLAIMSIMRPSQAPNSLQPFLQEKCGARSDAGTPLVSDPGFRLVGEAREAGIRVVPVPGASAILAALAASGLPTDAFMFCGFLPAKHGQRQSKLESLKTIDATLVFYESPNRAAATLSDMVAVFGGGAKQPFAAN
ncbi:16S rRNA (cytidine(1402)-2'-O)-methyltransferase [Falsochrobactrum ovis]|uniref:16S rRNA (cytidine(1402)-2'-O)-methyltransferase n=1 Tax=Falsochrobactrum ovis TaxID=1293442 RepID=UPI003608BA00